MKHLAVRPKRAPGVEAISQGQGSVTDMLPNRVEQAAGGGELQEHEIAFLGADDQAAVDHQRFGFRGAVTIAADHGCGRAGLRDELAGHGGTSRVDVGGRSLMHGHRVRTSLPKKRQPGSCQKSHGHRTTE